MEFKYRAGDDRPSSHTSPSTTVGYFSDQAAFRCPYSSPCLFPERMRENLIQVSLGHSQSVDFMQNPSDVREATYLRDMEKQRIREEIIAEELARRRVLEAEVKREVMVEREMAMRRAGEMGVPKDERFSRQSVSRLFMRHFEDQQLAFTSRFLRDPLSQPPEVPLRLPEPPCTEVKASSESNKDKFIVLARPDSNISEKKRKTSPESGLQALPSTSSKKPKEEWSCALCQVSATSEKGLNEHLLGRKHKAKEGLRVQRMAENSNTRPFPNTTGKLSQVPVVKQGKADKLPETGNGSTKRTKLTDKDLHLPLENQGAEKSGNENQGETTRTAPELKERRKFKFWCEMCSVGAYSKVVMDDHEKGKGHRSRLEKIATNGEALPTPTSTSSTISVIAEINQMAKDENMVTNEANENTEEGIADVDGSCPSPLTVPHPEKEDIAVYN